MKRNYFPRLFFIVSMMIFMNCCTSSKPASSTADASSSNPRAVSTTEGNNGLTLVNYLRRIPGVQVDQRGNDFSVMIRGMSSVGSNNQPLFVVNNSPVGNNYQDAVNAVDINDIKTINVLQGTEGQQTYGMRGANGVIQIITKSAAKPKENKPKDKK
jgi:outer membrane cobalamin receptor